MRQLQRVGSRSAWRIWRIPIPLLADWRGDIGAREQEYYSHSTTCRDRRTPPHPKRNARYGAWRFQLRWGQRGWSGRKSITSTAGTASDHSGRYRSLSPEQVSLHPQIDTGHVDLTALPGFYDSPRQSPCVAVLFALTLSGEAQRGPNTTCWTGVTAKGSTLRQTGTHATPECLDRVTTRANKLAHATQVLRLR